MKILFVNYCDVGGGTAIAQRRLFEAMLAAKINVYMGVTKKYTHCDRIFELPKNKNYEKQEMKKNKKKLLQTTNPMQHCISKLSKIDVNFINKSDFDVVHLHWIGGGNISVEDVAKIKKPIAWTMHDSWVFCGAEGHPNVREKDMRFIEGYTKENFPKTSSGVDICRQTWERKRKAWKNCKFNFISPSNYEAISFEKSALFKGQKATIIPNLVPGVFRKLNVKEFKKYMNIPLNKKIIGFGVANFVGVKGGEYLLKALAMLKNKEDLHIVIFGDAQSEFINGIKIQNTILGAIFNEKILTLIYNCLDCFVCPSIIESFGLVCLEALFCGVPVAAFNTGGIPDVVEHKKNGYLAKPFVASDLAKGIEFCLENKKELSKKALAKAKSDYFSEKSIVEKHLEVYRASVEFAP
jgi:glycosyltransferase involved in cell wall biosynthesis